jgi:hypothetical protein
VRAGFVALPQRPAERFGARLLRELLLVPVHADDPPVTIQLQEGVSQIQQLGSVAKLRVRELPIPVGPLQRGRLRSLAFLLGLCGAHVSDDDDRAEDLAVVVAEWRGARPDRLLDALGRANEALDGGDDFACQRALTDRNGTNPLRRPESEAMDLSVRETAGDGATGSPTRRRSSSG